MEPKTYACIENGIVTNVIWLLEQNADDFPGAVECDSTVQIGDSYVDGVFVSAIAWEE